MGYSQDELDLLEASRLFAGLKREKLLDMLSCLHARRAAYKAEDVVIPEGVEIAEVGIVLSGRARSLKHSASGEPLMISLLEPGSFIGILLAASRERKSPVTVQAQEALTVLFLPAEKLTSPCSKGCPEHGVLFRNYLDSVAEKSLVLNDRIDCLIRRSAREKVMTYLHRVSAEKGRREFFIPLDRSALSNYLNIERSALSRELSRMRRDGLIQFRKNFFRIL